MMSQYVLAVSDFHIKMVDTYKMWSTIRNYTCKNSIYTNVYVNNDPVMIQSIKQNLTKKCIYHKSLSIAANGVTPIPAAINIST